MEFLAIYDRTQDDILNRTPKAFLTAADCNRIEDNCRILAQELGVAIQSKDWSIGDRVLQSDLQRIVDNLEELAAAYYTRQDAPALPGHPINTFAKINDLERFAWELHDIYIKNQQAYAYAGEFYAGEIGGI